MIIWLLQVGINYNLIKSKVRLLKKGATEALENMDCPVTSVYDFKYGVKT